MAIQTPERPDVQPSMEETRRLVLLYGLLAGICGCVGGVVAWRSIGWFPPPNAAAALIGSAVVFFAIGLLIGSARGPTRWVLGSLTVVAALVAPILLASYVPGIAQPTEHAIPGAPWLSISASPDGSPDLYLFRGDADHVVAFGETPETELFSTLSPDRRHIVYAANIAGGYDLYVLDLDANAEPVGEPRPISALPGDEAGGSWSPDGSQIVFQVTEDGATEIRVVGVDGGASKVLPAPALAIGAEWSPDGRSIAFAAPRDDTTTDYDIWIMAADGSHARPVGDAGPDDWWPTWSPDGTEIAFSSGYGQFQDAFLVDIDGTYLTRLTDRRGSDAAYGWSPDGSKILISSDRSNTGGRFLYMMDPDGSDVQLVLRI